MSRFELESVADRTNDLAAGSSRSPTVETEVPEKVLKLVAAVFRQVSSCTPQLFHGAS